MFLRFFILLLSLGLFISCGPESSSEEEVEETGKVVVECSCRKGGRWSTTTGRGKTFDKAKVVAQEKCSEIKVFNLIIRKLGEECNQLDN